MRKIPCLFARDSAGTLTSAYNSAALWVLDGEGIATRKWDGTAVRITNQHHGLISDAKVLLAGQTVWARYNCQRGKQPPLTFHACQDPDPITGHWPGWVVADRPQDKWIRAAVGDQVWQPGTYEACGPHINGNPEDLIVHTFKRHGADVLDLEGYGLTQLGLASYLDGRGIEGIVWWRNRDNQDCDKAKITAAALGVSRQGLELSQFVFDG